MNNDDIARYWKQAQADTFTDGDGRMYVIDDWCVTIFEWAFSSSRGVTAMRVPIASFLAAAKEASTRGAAPSAAELCKCGHGSDLHVMFSQQQRCEANVHTTAPLGGGSVFPCSCRQFDAAE